MKNEPVYHSGMRELQDLRDTRRIADRLAEVTLHSAFTEEDCSLIHRCRMFCIATADEHGYPDCSYKGGRPGFVNVLDENTLAIPDYDGNGMYRTWGNVLVNPQVGLLFLDFETPKRMRVNGRARISHDPALVRAVPRRRVRGAGHCRTHLSQLPALHASHAAGGGVRVRTATRIHASGAGMEDFRGVPRCASRAGSQAGPDMTEAINRRERARADLAAALAAGDLPRG